MQEVARVYAEALFDAAERRGELERVQGELAQFADAVDGSQDLQVFLFSPYFSSAEKRDGLRRALDGASEELLNFLDLLTEKHRLPMLGRIRRELDEMWERQNRRIAVTVTSAIELDPSVIEQIGKEIERKTGQAAELSTRVDGEIIGGIVLQVGNMVLDASIRNRLNKLKMSVA